MRTGKKLSCPWSHKWKTSSKTQSGPKPTPSANEQKWITTWYGKSLQIMVLLSLPYCHHFSHLTRVPSHWKRSFPRALGQLMGFKIKEVMRVAGPSLWNHLVHHQHQLQLIGSDQIPPGCHLENGAHGIMWDPRVFWSGVPQLVTLNHYCYYPARPTLWWVGGST